MPPTKPQSEVNETPAGSMTFWQHLEVLRWVIVRVIAVVGITAVVAFCLKDELFEIVLAPRSSDFITFRWIGTEPFRLQLMNTGLTEQFMVHIKVAFYAGLLVALPYVLYELFAFISPALYRRERATARWTTGSAYAMFMVGTLVNYLLVFPLTVRFLGTYQVSSDVANMLTLNSYIDTLISLSFLMGMVFELPVACAILAKMGLIDGSLMKRYRRHAIVAIVVVAAVITPTTDAFTLLVVALPIWLLYEGSVVMVSMIGTKHKQTKDE